ncbi:phosphohydrolase [Endomicrobiia bacterium]|nr:phosphohydrolase [Endomicrobiia bacterium]
MCKNAEKQIFDYLSENLSPKKLEHSYNVAILAAELASKHNLDIVRVRTAGLLHDCAKFMTDEEFIDFFKKRDKTLKYFKKNVIKFSPHLLHSFAGEIIAKEKFKIKNRDTLNAIKNHTLGRKNMHAIEKIIFVADCVSYDRKLEDAKRIRNLAKNDLNKAFFEVLTKKIEHIIDKGMWLCPKIIDTWNWYVSNNKKDN